ncbi:myoinositol oxidoreductase [Hyphopichia burtonii NRRL Y-1933]|uniref:Myoinositol oxidoreductase n=1 Tax=Hyphopichia burtonii NRRL Y-1933 TaxID=984485 RepID=A0A1E4RN30_9ASCO|nr:myoinositol oxidoreductase [Hyphopichia burtonii NRRL Y-1933]ODV68677.1 myoinositol oxidoreductase [Hyphopichia burtonii NRRL Y-1933]
MYPVSFNASSPAQDVIDIPNKVRFIVIGAGLIGPRHANHVQQRNDTELVAIIDHSLKGPAVAKSLGVRLFKNLEEFFHYCDSNYVSYPDAAIVATPNHTHIDMGLKLAAKKINILMEKPLAPTPKDCKVIIDYCNQQKVKLLIGHHRRFNPYIVATKENLDRLGNLIAIQGTWSLRKPQLYFDEKPWRSSKELGGGTLLINLIHDLDLLQYLIGPIVKVYAELLPKQRSSSNSSEDSDKLVDEGASLTLRFANGCCGTFICSDNVTSPFSFEVGTGENPTIPFNDSIQGIYRIFGSEGTLSLPDLKLYHQQNLPPNLEKPKPFDLQLDHFIKLLKNEETTCKCSGEDALSALLVINAVIESIDTGLPQYVQAVDDV